MVGQNSQVLTFCTGQPDEKKYLLKVDYQVQ